MWMTFSFGFFFGTLFVIALQGILVFLIYEKFYHPAILKPDIDKLIRERNASRRGQYPRIEYELLKQAEKRAVVEKCSWLNVLLARAFSPLPPNASGAGATGAVGATNTLSSNNNNNNNAAAATGGPATALGSPSGSAPTAAAVLAANTTTAATTAATTTATAAATITTTAAAAAAAAAASSASTPPNPSTTESASPSYPTSASAATPTPATATTTTTTSSSSAAAADGVPFDRPLAGPLRLKFIALIKSHLEDVRNMLLGRFMKTVVVKDVRVGFVVPFVSAIKFIPAAAADPSFSPPMQPDSPASPGDFPASLLRPFAGDLLVDFHITCEMSAVIQVETILGIIGVFRIALQQMSGRLYFKLSADNPEEFQVALFSDPQLSLDIIALLGGQDMRSIGRLVDATIRRHIHERFTLPSLTTVSGSLFEFLFGLSLSRADELFPEAVINPFDPSDLDTAAGASGPVSRAKSARAEKTNSKYLSSSDGASPAPASATNASAQAQAETAGANAHLPLEPSTSALQGYSSRRVNFVGSSVEYDTSVSDSSSPGGSGGNTSSSGSAGGAAPDFQLSAGSELGSHSHQSRLASQSASAQASLIAPFMTTVSAASAHQHEWITHSFGENVFYCLRCAFAVTQRGNFCKYCSYTCHIKCAPRLMGRDAICPTRLVARSRWTNGMGYFISGGLADGTSGFPSPPIGSASGSAALSPASGLKATSRYGGGAPLSSMDSGVMANLVNQHSSGFIIGALTVRVISAAKLAAKDLNGRSDPYCLLCFGRHQCKTKVILETLNPIWDETFEFPVVDGDSSLLRISIFDWDKLSKDDFLGFCVIDVTKLVHNAKNQERFTLQARSSEEEVSGTLTLELTIQSKDRQSDPAKSIMDLSQAPQLTKTKAVEQPSSGRSDGDATAPHAGRKSFVVSKNSLVPLSTKEAGEVTVDPAHLEAVMFSSDRDVCKQVCDSVLSQKIVKAQLLDAFASEMSCLTSELRHWVTVSIPALHEQKLIPDDRARLRMFSNIDSVSAALEGLVFDSLSQSSMYSTKEGLGSSLSIASVFLSHKEALSALAQYCSVVVSLVANHHERQMSDAEYAAAVKRLESDPFVRQLNDIGSTTSYAPSATAMATAKALNEAYALRGPGISGDGHARGVVLPPPNMALVLSNPYERAGQGGGRGGHIPDVTLNSGGSLLDASVLSFEVLFHLPLYALTSFLLVCEKFIELSSPSDPDYGHFVETVFVLTRTLDDISLQIRQAARERHLDSIRALCLSLPENRDWVESVALGAHERRLLLDCPVDVERVDGELCSSFLNPVELVLLDNALVLFFESTDEFGNLKMARLHPPVLLLSETSAQDSSSSGETICFSTLADDPKELLTLRFRNPTLCSRVLRAIHEATRALVNGSNPAKALGTRSKDLAPVEGAGGNAAIAGNATRRGRANSGGSSTLVALAPHLELEELRRQLRALEASVASRKQSLATASSSAESDASKKLKTDALSAEIKTLTSQASAVEAKISRLEKVLGTSSGAERDGESGGTLSAERTRSRSASNRSAAPTQSQLASWAKSQLSASIEKLSQLGKSPASPSSENTGGESRRNAAASRSGHEIEDDDEDEDEDDEGSEADWRQRPRPTAPSTEPASSPAPSKIPQSGDSPSDSPGNTSGAGLGLEATPPSHGFRHFSSAHPSPKVALHKLLDPANPAHQEKFQRTFKLQSDVHFFKCVGCGLADSVYSHGVLFITPQSLLFKAKATFKKTMKIHLEFSQISSVRATPSGMHVVMRSSAQYVFDKFENKLVVEECVSYVKLI